MEADHPALLALVRAVCDGAAVDWNAALDDAGESYRAAVSELRVVAEVANLSRSLGGETERLFEPAAKRPGSAAARRTVGRWGHLHLLEHVASGSFGDVYRAWDPAIDREVALKLLRARDAGSDTDESIEEGRHLARIRHPNVVTVYGAARIDGRVGIWMEFIRGRTLVEVVRGDGALQIDAVARIGGELCDAVAAVHAAGLLHRDIKAQNVMVSEDGRVVLMDLGAGRLAAESHLDLVGTPLYLAPEILLGQAPSVRSDVYSLGVLLRFLATGGFAGRGGTSMSQLSAPLERIVAHATAISPAARYPNARELREALGPLVQHSRAHALRFASVAAALLVAAGVAIWRLIPVAAIVPSPRLVPLTQMPGALGSPTFSPDGTQVAFEWWSDKDEGFAIYLKRVGSSELHRLVEGQDPSWSPDGRRIAFTQEWGQPLHLISPDGGPAATLGKVPPNGQASWSPDGRYLAIARSEPSPTPTEHGIYLVSLATGDSRLIARSTVYDGPPAFSPDGRRLAYASISESGAALNVVDLDAELNPIGEPRPVTGHFPGMGRVTWTRDGSELLYDDGNWPPGWRHPLWRVPADGSRAPEQVLIAGPNAVDPTVSRIGDRLAFHLNDAAREVYRFVADGPPAPVLLSSFFDSDPSFSSDGAHLAFSSSRAGDSTDIWIANADGSDARPLTPGPGHLQASPRWSPDDRQIAYVSQAFKGTDPDSHVWIVNSDGSNPRQLTHEAGGQASPAWSHDGRWLYFTRYDTRGPQIWRVPAAGGAAQPVVTAEPASYALETADGHDLLYDNGETSSLRMISLSDRSVRTLLECQNGFAPAQTGIYYLTCAKASKSQSRSRPDIRWLNPHTGEDRLLGSINRQDTGHDPLAVSPDETTVLYSRWNPGTSGLWMIENFR